MQIVAGAPVIRVARATGRRAIAPDLVSDGGWSARESKGTEGARTP